MSWFNFHWDTLILDNNHLFLMMENIYRDKMQRKYLKFVFILTELG